MDMSNLAVLRMTTGKMSWLAERQRVSLAKHSEFRYARVQTSGYERGRLPQPGKTKQPRRFPRSDAQIPHVTW